MDLLNHLFGQGKDLTTLQMSCRGIVVFFIALLLIRLSGRRSFGIRSPLDNIIMILLGAILSRAVVGASPFISTIVTCTIIVIMHRVISVVIAKNRHISRLVEGRRFTLYENGRFITENMRKALVCKEDIMQGVRKTALTEELSKVKTIYMERNGEITVVKKEE